VAPDCGFSRGTKRTSADISHDNDLIVDTIGAIAIDDRGHIAAASSSGGIGMKHRGRLGPAALVRVGTAVVPLDPKDVEGKTVAAVTSGTGEHMATTMASQRCAERIFYNTRQGPTGRDIHEDDEDAIMESFVTDDFMNHPGVKNSPSAGAIGVMAVKKTQGAIYLFFAHNTDSFALSSMASTDTQPLCLMSRLGDDIEVTRGARRIRLDPVARK
jgi:taspase (threonine aspartase 1)